MKVTIEELRNNKNFRLVNKINHETILAFIKNQINNKTISLILFYLFNGAILTYFLYIIVYNLIDEHYIWHKFIKHSLGGIFFSCTFIVPVHELIHGLFYRLYGARKVRIEADYRNFVFYVTADNFVATRNQMIVIALAPFVIINSFFLFGYFEFGKYMSIASLIALLIHSFMCIGDFAIINYFIARKKKIYTYDDSSRKASYFYEQVKLPYGYRKKVSS